MDDFISNVNKFTSTIYGKEMRESLVNCFNLIYKAIVDYSDKLADANQKITKLEQKGGD